MTHTLIKTLPSALKTVKSSAIIFAIAATSAIAPSAFANNMMETKLTVKIAIAELSNPVGIEKTYKTLQDKATAFCKADTPSLSYLGESVGDCVEDLMNQFVTTSDATPLKAYHEKITETAATKKLALN